MSEASLFWGPLWELISNPDVTEILVDSHDSIWSENQGQLKPTGLMFQSPLAYRTWLEGITQQIRQFPSFEIPFAQGHIDLGPLGALRIQVVTPPVTQASIVALRKHRDQHWSLKELEAQGWASSDAVETLRKLIQKKASILIVGPTGTGKTSLLGALIHEISPEERLVVLEDTQELPTNRPGSLRLLSRWDPQGILPEITLQDLTKTSLRLRPDRLVLGEVRGPEAKDLVLALSTGHQGSLCTLHAHDGHEALLRLEMLIQMGAPQWEVQTVRHLIHRSLQYIVSVERTPGGQRRLRRIQRIASLESFGFSLEDAVYPQAARRLTLREALSH